MSNAKYKAIPVNTGTTSGDVLYFDGADWQPLAVGVNSEILTLTAGLPSWAAGYDDTPVFYKDGTRAMTGNINLSGNYLSGNGANNGILLDASGRINADLILNNTKSLQARNSSGDVRSIFTPWADDNLYFGADTGFDDFIIRTSFTGNIIFKNVANEAMRVNTTGLGIGVDPAARLHVKGSGATSSTYTIKFENSVVNLLSLRNDQRADIDCETYINAISGTAKLYVSTNFGLFDYGSYTEIRRLTAGNVNFRSADKIYFDLDDTSEQIAFRYNTVVKHIFEDDTVGIATGATGTSTLEVGGSIASAINHLTLATFTLTIAHSTILADCASNDITITLPAASTCSGRVYNIKRIDSTANTLIIDGDSSDEIDGDLTKVITTQWDSISIQSDGSDWFII